MSKKIATVSTVFAACDRLDAANERWNREDVRDAMGGGGYVVIDPLIKAWRALKPLRDVAPTTPAELLHQVAGSLESHCNGYRGEMESRLAESQRVFDTAVAELSERVAGLETALEAGEASLQDALKVRSGLVRQLESCQLSLAEEQQLTARLVVEDDSLRGQILRMETDNREAIEKHHAETRELAKENARERARVSDEHSAAQARQRQELTETAEQAENRLMILLDKERQTARESTEELADQLAESREKAQSQREQSIGLDADVRQLTKRNQDLEAELAMKAEAYSDLTKELDREREQGASIQRAFDAYKEEHKISGDLAALQATVNALQAKLE